MTITLRLISALTICSYLFGTNLNAQSAWLPPSDGNSITVEAYRFDRPSGNRFANSTAMFLTARIQGKPGLSFVLQMPLIRTDEFLFTNSSNPFRQNPRLTIGNPYVGISIHGKEAAALTLDFGIRRSLTSKDRNTFRGIESTTDFGRWEPFAPNFFMIHSLLGARWLSSDSPFSAWVRGGGSALSSNQSSNPEFFIDYETGIWFTSRQFTVGTTINGRFPLSNRRFAHTTDELNQLGEGRPIIEDQSEFLIGFGANLSIGSLRPGVTARFPVKKNLQQSLGSNIHTIYGANITYLFGGNDKKESDWR